MSKAFINSICLILFLCSIVYCSSKKKPSNEQTSPIETFELANRSNQKLTDKQLAQAVSRDFDKDGDLDIAAIAFFPDYFQAPQEGFVYFENTNSAFEPYTFSNTRLGRWLTMEAGDFDKDQDIDIVLGSFIFSNIPVPDLCRKQWVTNGPEAVIFINQLRGKDPAGRPAQ